MHTIARHFLELAKIGDLAAAKLVLLYAVGRPKDPVDPDTLEEQEWQRCRQAGVPLDELGGVLHRFPAPVACDLLREVWQAVTARLTQQLLVGLQEIEQRERIPTEPGDARPVAGHS
jgi:hypothetical protein